MSEYVTWLQQTAKTYSWYFKHEVGEVEVLPCMPLYNRPHVYEPTRGWLWQLWSTRVGVLLYSQQLEVVGKRKLHIKLRVTFFRPEDVQIVKQARGWPEPSKELMELIQRGDALAEMEARQIIAELWETI